jgi:hypothetical protein
MGGDVFEEPARQVVGHTNRGAQLRESIGQVGTNEGCPPVTSTCLPLQRIGSLRAC